MRWTVALKRSPTPEGIAIGLGSREKAIKRQDGLTPGRRQSSGHRTWRKRRDGRSVREDDCPAARLWNRAVSAWWKWLRQALTFGTSNKRVTFIRPFVLKGLDGVQPSGTYSVGTGARPAGFFSFFKGNAASTWIRVCRNPGTAGVLQLANIDPLDLAAALIRDACRLKEWGQECRQMNSE